MCAVQSGICAPFERNRFHRTMSAIVLVLLAVCACAPFDQLVPTANAAHLQRNVFEDELRHYAKADYGNAGGDDNDDDDDVSEAHSAAQQQQQFYEVDALGDDYVDFGAVTGPKGAFTWHATYRLEKERR